MELILLLISFWGEQLNTQKSKHWWQWFEGGRGGGGKLVKAEADAKLKQDAKDTSEPIPRTARPQNFKTTHPKS